VSALGGQLAVLGRERDGARAEIERLAAALDNQGVTLRETHDALEAACNTLTSRTDALKETTEALAEARAQGEEQAHRRDHAERVAAASAQSLQAAQERIALLQVAQEVALARAELLERAEASAKAAAALARSDLEAAQSLVEQLRGSVSERDAQLAVLTATVQAEQQSRDADTRHWLSRLSEHQAAVTDARGREATLVEEKNALTLEAQRLRQDLRRMQAEVDGRAAGPDRTPVLTPPS
jgi:chromosome segregation ATPase